MAGKNKKQKGLNRDMHLARNILNTKKIKYVPTRNGYGEGLVEAGKNNPKIMVLCADLTESTRSLEFKNNFPDRFVQMGVSEQSMASIAAGMSLTGKIPFISSYAAFSPGRNWEQIKTCIAIQNSNVKIAGAHTGVSVGPDGATHQMVEDISIMRVMPNMKVIVPADAIETKKTTILTAKLKGPYYLRFAREKSAVFTTEKTPFKIGKAEIYRHGYDLTIIAAGPILYEALLASDILSKDFGIETRVINSHSIKPFDTKTLITAAKETGAIVTAEEAQVAGGLAGVVSETLALTTPVPIERIGIHDRYGESGKPREVQESLGLTSPFIVMAAQRVLKRKLGQRVTVVPEHISSAKNLRAEMRKTIINKALKQVPKKWKSNK